MTATAEPSGRPDFGAPVVVSPPITTTTNHHD